MINLIYGFMYSYMKLIYGFMYTFAILPIYVLILNDLTWTILEIEDHDGFHRSQFCPNREDMPRYTNDIYIPWSWVFGFVWSSFPQIATSITTVFKSFRDFYID